jgi:hypothetical protein
MHTLQFVRGIADVRTSFLKTVKKDPKKRSMLPPSALHINNHHLTTLVSPAAGIDISKSNVDLLLNKYYMKYTDMEKRTSFL